MPNPALALVSLSMGKKTTNFVDSPNLGSSTNGSSDVRHSIHCNSNLRGAHYVFQDPFFTFHTCGAGSGFFWASSVHIWTISTILPCNGVDDWLIWEAVHKNNLIRWPSRMLGHLTVPVEMQKLTCRVTTFIGGTSSHRWVLSFMQAYRMPRLMTLPAILCQPWHILF